jgi:hypothetical protein
LQNLGSAARTEMTYKAQQVADVIRYLNLIQRSNPTAVPSATNTGLEFPLTQNSASPITITTLSGSNLDFGYWGPPTSTLPDAVGVLDPADLRYSIRILVAGPSTSGLETITVQVAPNLTGAGPRYLNSSVKWKEVDYVIQLPP